MRRGPAAPAWVLAVLVGLGTAVLYVETWWSPFQYDDWVTVVAPDPLAAAGDGSGFRPVTSASYAWDAAWARLVPSHPSLPYHAANVLLHVLAVGLAAWLGRLWWADRPAATAAALIVAVHPFNAEAVNYISARASLVAACGELLALGAYTVWARSSPRSRPAAVAAGLATVLALGAKESAATLPLLLLLVDRTIIRPRDSWRACAGRVWPWFAVTGVYAAVRVIVAADVADGADYSREARGSALLTGFGVMWLGLRDWWWPARLTVEHGVEAISGPAAWGVLVATAAVAVLAWAGWRRVRKTGRALDGLPTFALAWWTIAALPAMILPFITHVALYQENRFYLAGFGMAWAVGLAAAGAGRRMAARWGPVVPWAVGAAALLGLVALTHARNEVWKTEPALWSDAIAKSPRSALAHNMLGAAYLALERPDLAVPPLERAVRLDPGYPRAANNLGAAYAMTGRWGEATTQFQRTLALDPRFDQARRNLVFAHLELARLADEQGRSAEATQHYRQALAVMPLDGEWAAVRGTVEERLRALRRPTPAARR